jgi:hypothetical protein
VAILVDEAIWPWRGARWAHLVSDAHPDELHDFAHRLGMPYLAFQGDHYDIHTRLRERALAAGARAVSGRELVSALRDAGLRRRGGVEPWQWRWRVRPDEVAPGHLPGGVAEAVISTAGLLQKRARSVEVATANRGQETLVVVSSTEAVEVDAGVVSVGATVRLHRSSGERGTFVEWQLAGEEPQPA